jgi:excisionase family DNA binding protein
MSNQPLFKQLYVSRKQAAAMVGSSDQTIAKLNRQGKPPAYNVGRSVRIKVADLEALMAQSRRVQ